MRRPHLLARIYIEIVFLYEQVSREEFKARPLGAGPVKFVSQEAGGQMVFEAWMEAGA